MTTGDELTVTDAYEYVVEQWAEGARIEVVALWWSDPEASGFDPLSEWPSYRESRMTIDLKSAVAVEDEHEATIAAIDRARRHHLAQD